MILAILIITYMLYGELRAYIDIDNRWHDAPKFKLVMLQFIIVGFCAGLMDYVIIWNNVENILVNGLGGR